MRTTFQEELDLLEATLQEEGALVLRALRGALNALEQRDTELADEVILVRRRRRSALPPHRGGDPVAAGATDAVASDLRLVLAILHVNLHLERIG